MRKITECNSSIWKTISAWNATAVELGLVYSRSGGGLMQTARAHIVSLTESSITLKADGASMFIVLDGAHFSNIPQIFFTADLADNFQVAGVSIALANHDWLFLSTATKSGELTLPHDGSQLGLDWRRED